MFDFKILSNRKFRIVKDHAFASTINPYMVPDEHVEFVLKSGQIGLVFTNKRIMAVLGHIMESKKIIHTVMYGPITAISTEADCPSPRHLGIEFMGFGVMDLLINSDDDFMKVYRFVSEKLVR